MKMMDKLAVDDPLYLHTKFACVGTSVDLCFKLGFENVQSYVAVCVWSAQSTLLLIIFLPCNYNCFIVLKLDSHT